MASALNDDLDTVEKRLAKNADLHAVDQMKKSAMAYAPSNGPAEAVSRLLTAGVDVNSR
jgi:hypothetical protein